METGGKERPVLRNEFTTDERPRGVVLRNETTTDGPPRGQETTATTCDARTTAAEDGPRPEETTESVWLTETRDATEETDVTRDRADEDLPDGRVNGARLVSQHPANVLPNKVVDEDFGLGRTVGVPNELEERAGSPAGRDSPLREESCTADAASVSQTRIEPEWGGCLDEAAALAHMERVVTVTDGTQGEERETSPDPTPNECEETAADEKDGLGAHPRWRSCSPLQSWMLWRLDCRLLLLWRKRTTTSAITYVEPAMPYDLVGNLVLWKSNKMTNLTNSPKTNYAPYPNEIE
ncbi:hypothetical protein PF010_g8207 [Phytophthora fragariae]|uniref:Uncharacterized protein n=2 Tax=Phytophthora fragariae TaxID=53985 RepID=A0A6A3KZE8_9STRA|nr:hypothetical protein PF011_g8798 [Phytophthora fragariae]KAE9118470.1 hypothetical protein PF010_g8207 [Phytophthora fragariae]